MPDTCTSYNGHDSVLFSIAATIVDALKHYGLDHRPIIAEAGFDPDIVYLPAQRVSTRKIKKLWDLSVQNTNDLCFGLVYASYIQPSALHGLGFSWLASHTLRDGLNRLIRFQKILATQVTLKMTETDTGYRLYFAVSQKDDPFQFADAAYDGRIASIFKICQIMIGPDLKPLFVSFEHSPPHCSDKFEQFFGIPVQFNADKTAIEFDKQTCNLPTSSANPELARINDQIVIDYLNQFDRGDLETRVRTCIIEHLPSGVPKQINIARELNLSLRNLQRKLSLSNTSYKELLNTLRHEMACQYLSSPQYPIIEVSYLLGFSDPSNFSRAFKRWQGLTPIQFRQEKLAD